MTGRRPSHRGGGRIAGASTLWGMATKKSTTAISSVKKGKGVPIQPRKGAAKIGKATKVAGRRAGGALRSEQARQQKRRDSR